MTDKDLVIDAFNTNSDSLKPLVISSISESISGTEFAFRNYHYALTYISWKPVGEKKELCVDTGYIIIIANRTFISINSEIKRIIAKIFIRGLDSKIHYSNKYAILIFYIEGVLLNKTYTFAEIKREIHIVDNLKVGILIGSNILTPKRIVINFITQSIKIDSYRNIIISMNSRAYSKSIKRVIKFLSRIILLLHTTTQISVTYFDKLSKNRDLLFEL